jgi:hypothetical protein
MPVIRCGDGDRIHVLVGEELAHGFVFFCLGGRGRKQTSLSTLSRGLIDVAQRGYLAIRNFHIGVQVRRASTADADEADIDTVVGAPHSRRGHGGGSALKESTA